MAGRTDKRPGAGLMRFEVSHPDYPAVEVSSIGADSATVEAARQWGVAEDWGKIAAYCTVKKLGKARKPRCRRCGREFGRPGGAEAYCPDCEQALALVRREKANVRTRDRRAGYRGA